MSFPRGQGGVLYYRRREAYCLGGGIEGARKRSLVDAYGKMDFAGFRGRFCNSTNIITIIKRADKPGRKLKRPSMPFANLTLNSFPGVAFQPAMMTTQEPPQKACNAQLCPALPGKKP